MNLSEAIDRSVEECIEEGILVAFFKKDRAEVKAMSIFEFNQEKYQGELREEGRQEGRLGVVELYRKLQEDDRIEDWQRSIQDMEYQTKLLKEYSLI